MKVKDIKNYDVKPPFRKLKGMLLIHRCPCGWTPRISMTLFTKFHGRKFYLVLLESIFEVIDYDPNVKAFYNL